MKKKYQKKISTRKSYISSFVSKTMLLLLLAASPVTLAQSPPAFDDDVNDEVQPAAAPVDSSIALLTCLGIALGIYFIRKTQNLGHIK